MTSNYHNDDTGYALPPGLLEGLEAYTRSIPAMASIPHTTHLEPTFQPGINKFGGPAVQETHVDAYHPDETPIYKSGTHSGEHGVGHGESHAGELRDNGHSSAHHGH
jgi:hypothetical protein